MDECEDVETEEEPEQEVIGEFGPLPRTWAAYQVEIERRIRALRPDVIARHRADVYAPDPARPGRAAERTYIDIAGGGHGTAAQACRETHQVGV